MALPLKCDEIGRIKKKCF